ncbi:MAG TPA: ImmA/IrrE family metallo-endopeptidase [Jatrophihabitans sp.]|nr:ImmA/IrrE family metallo-endopeptidase [Jatrophihabitans sp.]
MRHSNHYPGEVSVLASLRSLTPTRSVTLPRALHIADRQAARLLQLRGVETIPVLTTIVSELPRIIVEQDSELPLHAASGCSDWDSCRRAWVISINPREPRTRQRFTVLHEYKHIIDHGGPEIQMDNWAARFHRAPAEIVADYFAGCVLIPKRVLNAAFYDGIQTATDLAQLFDVSADAIRVRLAQVGLADPHHAAQRDRAVSPYRTARYYRTAQRIMEATA